MSLKKIALMVLAVTAILAQTAEAGIRFPVVKNGYGKFAPELGIECFGAGETIEELCHSWRAYKMDGNVDYLSGPQGFSKFESFSELILERFPRKTSVAAPLLFGTYFGLVCLFQSPHLLIGTACLLGGMAVDVVKAPIVAPMIGGTAIHRNAQKAALNRRLKKFVRTGKLAPLRIHSERRFINLRIAFEDFGFNN